MAGIAPSVTSTPTQELSLSAWWQGIRRAPKTHVRYRYSVSKARKLIAYTRTTSVWRHVAVLLAYAVPGSIASLIPTFVVLQDPALGVIRNTGFFVHGALTTLATFSGGMFQARAVTSISHRDISTIEVIAIAVVGLVHFWIIMGLLGWYWRFPVPFTLVLGAAPYNVSLVWAVVLVLSRHMLRPSSIRTRLLVYLPSHTIQVFQILFYPAYSIFFENANQGWQIMLIGLFPICKYYIKSAVSAVSYHLGDFHREVGVAGVEILSSIYQATIIQNTPSYTSGILIIVVDIIQGIIDVHISLGTDPNAFSRSVAILQDDTKSIPDGELREFASARVSVAQSLGTRLRQVFPSAWQNSSADVVPTTAIAACGDSKQEQLPAKANEKSEITQTLEILQSIETILLVEYLETIAPIVNTIYLLVASQLESALYNPRLRSFHTHSKALYTAAASVFAYSFLQGLTLVAISVPISRRYKVSSTAILAFVLETHVWSLQGKMIAWFTLMFGFSVVHYGVDFSFKFDWTSSSHDF